MRPETDRLAAETAELAWAAGMALSNWTIIETNLTDLFLALSEIGNQDKGRIIMQAIVSFDARLTVVSELMDTWPWKDEEREMWGLLVRRIRSQFRKRHELAHFQIINASDGTHTRAVLSPFYSQHRALTGNLRMLSVPDINARKLQFRALAIAVSWFAGWADKTERREPDPRRAEHELIKELRLAVAQSRADKKRASQSEGE